MSNATSKLGKGYLYFVGAFVGVVILLCVFFYGVAVGAYYIYPWPLLLQLKEAVESLEASADVLMGKKLFEFKAPPLATSAVPVWDKEHSDNGLTFMTAFMGDRFGAKVIDMEGKELHRWDISFTKAFPDSSHVEFRAPDEAIGILGAHMFPNGDVVFNFNGGNFPDGGLVKIDKCSNILWTNKTFTHHAINIAPNGDVWAPVHEFHPEFVKEWKHLHAPYYEDQIARFSAADGHELDRISILDAIYQSTRQGLLLGTASTKIDIHSRDPLHLNDVEVLTPEMAPAFPMLKAGDIMVSLRDINTIAVIDPQTKLIKWAVTGRTLKQHDPDLLPNGHIIVFDNRWGEPASRVLEFDAQTQKVIWQYAGTPEDNFYEQIRGMQQVLPNGNVMTIEPEEGRIFEINRALGNKIVWDYYNFTKKDAVGQVTQAERFQEKDVDFLGAKCP